MNRWTALGVFRNVSELQSFAQAGQRLGPVAGGGQQEHRRTRAAPSCRLIHRTTRRLSLTDEGRIFFRQVVQMHVFLDFVPGVFAASAVDV